MTDSLRALRSRFLFWLSLAISVLSALLLFGSFSFNEQGIRILWFQTIENPAFAAGTPGPRVFMSAIFSGFYVRFWLAWGAMILAVVSTANILPEFLAGGAIDLSLSKPISRPRLLLLKVLGALLFVALQVALGVSIAFVLMGLKVGVWMPSILWAIPLIVLQFFFIYTFSALIAVLTRSTLASLILTLIFWFSVSMVQFSSNQIDEVVGGFTYDSKRHTAWIQRHLDRLERADREPRPAEIRQRTIHERELAEATRWLDTLDPWQRWLRLAETGVPKTGDIQKIIANLSDAPVGTEFFRLLSSTSQQVQAEIEPEEFDKAAAGERLVRDLSTVKSLVSSTAISAIILGVATFIFNRRDF